MFFFKIEQKKNWHKRNWDYHPYPWSISLLVMWRFSNYAKINFSFIDRKCRKLWQSAVKKSFKRKCISRWVQKEARIQKKSKSLEEEEKYYLSTVTCQCLAYFLSFVTDRVEYFFISLSMPFKSIFLKLSVLIPRRPIILIALINLQDKRPLRHPGLHLKATNVLCVLWWKNLVFSDKYTKTKTC